MALTGAAVQPLLLASSVGGGGSFDGEFELVIED